MRWFLRLVPAVWTAAALLGTTLAGTPHAQVVPEVGGGARPVADTTALALTLGDAVRLALTRSLDLQRAGYAVELRDLDLRTARTAADPELSVSVGPTLRYFRGYETDFFGIPQPGDIDSLGLDPDAFRLGTGGDLVFSVGASAQLNWLLYDGGAVRARQQAAEQTLAVARLDRDRIAEDVANGAAVQYLQVLQFADLVAVERTNLEADRALLARVQAEYDVGNRNLGDVLQQRAAIALGEQRLATALRNELVARLGLRQQLRLPIGAALALAPAPPELLALPTPDLDPALLVALAFDERADLDAQAALIEASRLDIRAAQAGRAPVVSLGSSVGTSYSTFDDNRGALGQVFDVNPNTSVGLSLSIPILDQGRTRRAVERAEVLLSDADAVLELQRLRVAADVETAVFDARAARARLAAAREGVLAAREALAAAEARYRQGSGIFLDVLDARRTLVQTEADVATARTDLLVARVTVAYQAGLLGDALVALD